MAAPAWPEQSASPRESGASCGLCEVVCYPSLSGLLVQRGGVSNWDLKVGLRGSSDWAVPGTVLMVPWGVLAMTVCRVTGSLKQQFVPKYRLLNGTKARVQCPISSPCGLSW